MLLNWNSFVSKVVLNNYILKLVDFIINKSVLIVDIIVNILDKKLLRLDFEVE